MKQITYHIDKEESEQSNLLAILLRETESSGTTHTFANKRPLSRHALEALSTEKDRTVLPLLIKEELKFFKRSHPRGRDEEAVFNSVHIHHAQSIEVLQLLAATGKLFFNKQRLIPDFFGKTSFHFLLKPAENGLLQASGRIKSSSEEFDLSTCDQISPGPPFWFIRNFTLKTVSGDLPWKWVKQAHSSSSLLLDKSQQKNFLDDNSDLETPVLFAEGAMTTLNHQTDPLPLLKLTDPRGAFANLWIQYHQGTAVPFHDKAAAVKDASGKPLCQRNHGIEEGWEKDLIEAGYSRRMMENSHYYCSIDKALASLTFLLELGWHIVDPIGRRLLKPADLRLTISSGKNDVLVQGKLTYEGGEVNLSQVVGALQKGGHLLALSPTTVGLIPQGSTASHLSVLAAEGEILSGGIKVRKNRFGAISTLFESGISIQADATANKLKSLTVQALELQPAPPSSAFHGELRPYQQVGVNWLTFLYENGLHALLADDMGLGKTVQILAFLSRLPTDLPSLLVLPTSLLFNWQKEIQRFLPSYSVTLHHGPLRSKTPSALQTSTLILTTYTTLRLDLELFKEINYRCIILDEAQAIKNARSQISQAACQLQAQFKVSVTGTPVENNLLELWAHFKFLMPDLFANGESFVAENQTAALDGDAINRIRRKVRPFLLRRHKADVAKELPEKIEQVVWVEMNAEQRQIYDGFLSAMKNNLLQKVAADGVSKHRMEIFEGILRLRQICCHPLLIDNMLDPSILKESAKLESLMDDLEIIVAEGGKVIVYSQFTTMLDLIGKKVSEKGWNFLRLDGSTSTLERERVVETFQNDKNSQVFLISLKAGGVGLNLTAADYVLLFDPWWNEAVENQAIGRAHRIGRNNIVIAKRYVTFDTIEEKIMTLKAQKRNLVDGLLDRDEFSMPITADDIHYLLS